MLCEAGAVCDSTLQLIYSRLTHGCSRLQPAAFAYPVKLRQRQASTKYKLRSNVLQIILVRCNCERIDFDLTLSITA